MKCPVCTVPLMVVERHGIEVDYCLQCQGLWFDEGELQYLGEAMKLTDPLPDISEFKQAQTNEVPRKCPRCSETMDKIHFLKNKAILLDRCPQGEGLWFDMGELGQAIRDYIPTTETQEAPILQFLGESFGR